MAESFDGGQSAVKDKIDDVKDTVSEKAGDMKDRAKDKVNELGQTAKDKAFGAASTGKNRLADKIDEFGNRIDERISVLEQQGGMIGRAAPLVQRASSAADATAEYLRNNELNEIRDDLVAQIKERPLLSVGIAFGAGVVLGQMFGGSDEEDRDEDRHARRSRGNKRSLVKSQITGPLGALLMTSLTGMIATQVRERIAGSAGGNERGQTGNSRTEADSR